MAAENAKTDGENEIDRRERREDAKRTTFMVRTELELQAALVISLAQTLAGFANFARVQSFEDLTQSSPRTPREDNNWSFKLPSHFASSNLAGFANLARVQSFGDLTQSSPRTPREDKNWSFKLP